MGSVAVKCVAGVTFAHSGSVSRPSMVSPRAAWTAVIVGAAACSALALMARAEALSPAFVPFGALPASPTFTACARAPEYGPAATSKLTSTTANRTVCFSQRDKRSK